MGRSKVMKENTHKKTERALKVNKNRKLRRQRKTENLEGKEKQTTNNFKKNVFVAKNPC